MVSNEREIILNIYKQLIAFLSHVYGESCEIVLHEIKDGRSEIIAMKNGQISGRSLGMESDELLKKKLEHYDGSDFHGPIYQKTPSGGDVKVNSYYIKDSKGELIGVLCINLEFSSIIKLKYLAEDFLKGFLDIEESYTAEDQTIEEYVDAIIAKTIDDSGIEAARMTMEEKMSIIKVLKDKGVFRTKGAAAKVASFLSVSEPSIYRYLKDI